MTAWVTGRRPDWWLRTQARPTFQTGPARCRCADYPTIVMGHGGGGKLGNELVEHLFLPAFRNPALENLGDAAVLDLGSGRLAMSTDSFVVQPLFLPRRIDRRTGREWHGERSGRLRRRAEISERELHSGRGISAGATWRPWSTPWRMRRHGGRADCHRRHQGGRARPRRRLLHQYGGHRRAARRDQCRSASRAGRAMRCWSPAPSAITAWRS